MEQDVSSFINALKSFTVDRVLSSVVLLVLCLLVIRIVTKILGKLLDRSSRVDPRMRKYIMAAVKALLYILTALIVAVFLTIPYWKGKYTRVKIPAAKADAKTGGDHNA